MAGSDKTRHLSGYITDLACRCSVTIKAPKWEESLAVRAEHKGSSLYSAQHIPLPLFSEHVVVLSGFKLWTFDWTSSQWSLQMSHLHAQHTHANMSHVKPPSDRTPPSVPLHTVLPATVEIRPAGTNLCSVTLLLRVTNSTWQRRHMRKQQWVDPSKRRYFFGFYCWNKYDPWQK